MKTLDQYQPLFDKIYTSHQSNECLVALQHAVDATYDTDKNVKDILDTYLPYDITDTLLALADNQGFKLREGADASRFMKDLIEAIKSMTIVDITIAFRPTYEQIHHLVTWWRHEYDPAAILNITVKPELIAGAVIGYNGKRHDLSLQKGLDVLLKST